MAVFSQETLKVAAIQLRASSDKAQNIHRASMAVQGAIASGAQLIVLPEVFVYRGKTAGQSFLKNVAESIPGPTTKYFAQLARTYKVHILMGSMYEKINGSQRVYNTSVFINAQGRIVGKYRKINLFNAVVGGKRIQEFKTFRAGNKLAIARVKGFSVGLSICYDLSFPELYRQYARQGVDIICVPSCFRCEIETHIVNAECLVQL